MEEAPKNTTKRGLNSTHYKLLCSDPVMSSDLCKVNAFPQMIVNETTTQVYNKQLYTRSLNT